jgi:hypothetical protein
VVISAGSNIDLDLRRLRDREVPVGSLLASDPDLDRLADHDGPGGGLGMTAEWKGSETRVDSDWPEMSLLRCLHVNQAGLRQDPGRHPGSRRARSAAGMAAMGIEDESKLLYWNPGA